MSDSGTKEQKVLLEKLPKHAIENSSSGLIRRAIVEIQRYLMDDSVDVVIYYPEIGVARVIKMLVKNRYPNVNVRWFQEYEGFENWIHNNEFDLLFMISYRFGNRVRKIRSKFPNSRIIGISCMGFDGNTGLLAGANRVVEIPFSVNAFYDLFSEELSIIKTRRNNICELPSPFRK